MILPSGDHLIQGMNVVTVNLYDAMAGGPDWPDSPGSPSIEDPSSPGQPYTWGTDTIGIDPDTGDPITGTTLGSRSPGGPDGSRPRRRKGGTGNPPSKNTLTRTDATPRPRACFAGSIRVEITKPAPDPFGWTGQRPAFTTTQGSCRTYDPPVIPRPATALILGTPPLIQQVKTFLATNVGSDSYATVLTDSIGGPGASCTTDATCPGFVIEDYAGNGAGTVITAS